MITAFIGVAGSGKDYQAGLLVKQGHVLMNFKDVLIDMVEDLMGFPIRGHYEKFKDSALGFTSPGSNITHYASIRATEDIRIHFPKVMTGRILLQRLGTEVMRKRDPDFWVKAWREKVLPFIGVGKNIVCADCRFPNEMSMIVETSRGIIERAAGESGCKFVFCNYKSFRYNAAMEHESEKMAQKYLGMGYKDLDEIPYDG